mgnify:CR=1 FL=1
MLNLKALQEKLSQEVIEEGNKLYEYSKRDEKIKIVIIKNKIQLMANSFLFIIERFKLFFY